MTDLLYRIRHMNFMPPKRKVVKDNKCILCSEPLLNLRAKYCSECKVELWKESSRLQKNKTNRRKRNEQ